MATTLKYRFAMRRRTAAGWVASNEILLQSEWGHESDTDKLKIGDGTTAWNDLEYFNTDDVPEGQSNFYFTKERLSESVVAGTGISIDVDAAGNTQVGLLAQDGGVLLTDWQGVQLSDWSGVPLEDQQLPIVQVLSVFNRNGNVVAQNGDYNTDQVPEATTPTNLWFTAARVRATVLTGLAAGTNVAIAAADTLLTALQKLQAQVTARQVIGNPVKMPNYTLATLPTASANQDMLVVCTNTAQGRRVVWSDGTNWLRLDTNTVAS